MFISLTLESRTPTTNPDHTHALDHSAMAPPRHQSVSFKIVSDFKLRSKVKIRIIWVSVFNSTFSSFRLSSSCIVERIKNLQQFIPNRVVSEEQHLNTLNQVKGHILKWRHHWFKKINFSDPLSSDHHLKTGQALQLGLNTKHALVVCISFFYFDTQLDGLKVFFWGF